MASLNKREARFIVEQLATFESPSRVAEAFKEEFGRVVTRQQIHNYDASKPYNRKKLSKELVELFYETRKSFREDVEEIPIANKSVRLKRLNKMCDVAQDRGNSKLAAALMEQAAKEVGEAYTNRQKVELTGKDGEALAFNEAVSRIYGDVPTDAA